MGITIYILLILFALLFTGLVCLLFGTKPDFKRVRSGFLLTSLLTGLYWAVTSSLSPEGNSPTTSLLLGGCIGMVLAGISNVRRKTFSFLVLSSVVILLRFQHLALVDSKQYTDYPAKRRAAIAGHNRQASREGKPSLPPVQITARWYTPFTGLYRVDPPVVGPWRPKA